MQSSIVLKLGGSAITDKAKICTPRVDVISRAVDEIAKTSKPIILLHGGGSYAHPFVRKKLASNGFRSTVGLRTVSEIELNLEQLTRIIGVGMLLRGRPFVPIRPMSFITLRNGEVNKHFLLPLTLALRSGMVPVIHGDICLDEVKGFGILSADRIASLLGEELTISRVLFGCDVDGVFEKESKQHVVKEVTEQNYESILKRIHDSGSDATGGMHGKMMEAIRLAKIGVETFIFNLRNPMNLKLLLDGDSTVGSRFVPWQ